MNKILVVFALVLNVTSALASSPSVDSKNTAIAAVSAILSINFTNSAGKNIIKVRRSDSENDGAHVTDTFVIRAHRENRSGQPTSAEFVFSVKILDGAVWSFSTSCPACG